jgi:hypothetical protein
LIPSQRTKTAGAKAVGIAEEFKKGEPEMPVLLKLAAEHGIEFLSDPP